MKLYKILYSFSKFPIFIKALIVLLTILSFAGFIFHVIEPSLFKTFFDGIWFAVVTAFTVGYGDFVPTTTSAKVVAIMLIMSGGASVTYFAGIVATKAYSKQNAINEGLLPYRGKDHFIIIGWNSKVKQILENYSKEDNKKEIVLIDGSLSELPKNLSYIHFIKGNPTIDTTFSLANLLHAKKVLITADQQKDENSADTLTVLTALTINGLHPEIPIIAEILTPSQLFNVRRAGASDVIHTNQYAAHLMTSSLLFHETATLVSQLLDRNLPHNITFSKLSKKQIGKSLSEIRAQLELNSLLIVGFKRNDQYFFNPKMSNIMLEDDQLILIT